MDEPKVTIVILNYNGWQDTIECLESLVKINYPKFNILIVDNKSENNSIEQIKSWVSEKLSKKPDFMNRFFILENDKNFGFAEGNNIGIRYSLENGADYILLLNNDTIVEHDFLHILVSAAQSDKNIFITGAVIKDYYSKEVIFTNSTIDHKFKAKEKTDFKYSNLNIIPTDRAHGCSMMLKAEYIKIYNLMLCSNLFLFCEEMDISIRAKNLGLKTVVANNSFVYHKEGGVQKKHSMNYRIYYCTRNRILIARKYLSGAKLFVFYLSFLLSNIIKLVAWAITFKKERIKCVIIGILDGLKNKSGQKCFK